MEREVTKKPRKKTFEGSDSVAKIGHSITVPEGPSEKLVVNRFQAGSKLATNLFWACALLNKLN